MNKETSNQIYSFLYLFALYLGIKLLPLIEWLPELWMAKLIQMILFFAICCLCFYEAARTGFIHDRRNQHRSYFFLAPFLLGCISNLMYCWIFQIPTNIQMDANIFVLDGFITLFCVVIEEYLFRVFFFSFLQNFIGNQKHKDFLVILFSAFAFSLIHLINLFGNNPLVVLTQVGYTFILGLILGYIALYFERPYVPIIGHFLFNFFNTNLYLVFYSASIDVNYILFSLGVGLAVLGYGVVLYLIDRRKKEDVTD